MAFLPYNPTRILSSTTSDGLLYMFQPGSSPKGTKLITINASSKLDDITLPYSTISPYLPFLKDDDSAYTPVIDEQGNIIVYSGNCQDGSQSSSLWHLDTKMDPNGNAAWKEMKFSIGELNGNYDLNGANHLSAGIAFSTSPKQTAIVYMFGGMCPNKTGLNAEDWTQSAEYSNKMLNVQPDDSNSSASTPYILNVSPSRGPPVPEAGFTITPLDPTFSSSDNNQETSKNQNFVLLGGHTSTAFINMSQVALFSLPEQSWTFLPVDSPSTAPNTDLAVRGSLGIDSRSGHSSLLTLDGKRIVVFGGWVGSITQRAEPQLAILELGQGYGGIGDWRWSVPNPSGPGPTSDVGVYGHGAAMLAGDVMMVVGGFEIPMSTNSRRKRQIPGVSSKTYFFNTTSNSWITKYKHPSVGRNVGVSHSTYKDSHRAAKRAGLGAGLAFGILAVIIVVIIYFSYSRRLQKRRQAREEELRRLAAGAQRFQLSGMDERNHRDFTGMTNRNAADNGYPWNGALPVVPGGRNEPEAERTGLLFEIPSPTRGLRRSLHSRGMYQPAPRYDNGRKTPDFSTIHPIDEREEYDEEPNKSIPDNEMIQRRDFDLLNNVPILNPFQDPHDRSRSPSPQSPQERHLEVQRWVRDWTAADALMHQQTGRISPEKTDRTSSTLSDQSARSMLSSSSVQQSASTMNRTLSQRSAALFNSGLFRSTNDTSPFERQGSQSGHYNRGEHRRSQSFTLYPNDERAVDTPNTFATARTSNPQGYEESEALLDDQSGEVSPSPTKLQSRARGWMGSVRRVFTGERSSSASPEHSGSTSSSPIKAGYTDAGVPRRAASTGTMLWQKRKGAKDWDVEGGHLRDEARKKDEGEEDEWDVESAVEKRVVQVMFTVPKEKLRVVNQNPDGDGESILSAEKGEAIDAAEEDKGRSRGKGKEKER